MMGNEIKLSWAKKIFLFLSFHTCNSVGSDANLFIIDAGRKLPMDRSSVVVFNGTSALRTPCELALRWGDVISTEFRTDEPIPLKYKIICLVFFLS